MTESALPSFAWFYENYIGVCEEMGIEPLPMYEFIELVSVLVNQANARVH